MIKKITAIIIALVFVVVAAVPVITNIEDTGKDLEVIVISGQSNGAYRPASVDLDEVNLSVELPQQEVYYYGTSSQPIFCGIAPSISYDSTFDSYGIYSMKSEDGWRVGGLDAPLAAGISNKSHHDVLVINAAISNASISFLQPSAIGGKYVNAMLSDALSKIPAEYRVHSLGFVWIQGESDKTTDVSTYVKLFGVVDNFYWSKGFDTCYMVQTRPQDSGNATEAQSLLNETRSDVHLVSTSPQSFTIQNGLMSSDDLHYTQKGRIIIAEDICASLTFKTPIYESAKTIVSIIPLIIIAGLVIGVVGSFIRNRD